MGGGDAAEEAQQAQAGAEALAAAEKNTRKRQWYACMVTTVMEAHAVQPVFAKVESKLETFYTCIKFFIKCREVVIGPLPPTYRKLKVGDIYSNTSVQMAQVSNTGVVVAILAGPWPNA